MKNSLGKMIMYCFLSLCMIAGAIYWMYKGWMELFWLYIGISLADAALAESYRQKYLKEKRDRKRFDQFINNIINSYESQSKTKEGDGGDKGDDRQV